MSFSDSSPRRTGLSPLAIGLIIGLPLFGIFVLAVCVSLALPTSPAGSASGRGLLVTVRQVEYGCVELADGSRSGEPALFVYFSIKNTTTGRVFRYSTCSNAGWFFSSSAAKLRDNFGNHYRLVLGMGSPVGRTQDARMDPGAEITDAVAFDRPVRNAETLFLDVPFRVFSEFKDDGVITIAIPAKMIFWHDKP